MVCMACPACATAWPSLPHRVAAGGQSSRSGSHFRRSAMLAAICSMARMPPPPQRFLVGCRQLFRRSPTSPGCRRDVGGRRSESVTTLRRFSIMRLHREAQRILIGQRLSVGVRSPAAMASATFAVPRKLAVMRCMARPSTSLSESGLASMRDRLARWYRLLSRWRADCRSCAAWQPASLYPSTLVLGVDAEIAVARSCPQLGRARNCRHQSARPHGQLPAMCASGGSDEERRAMRSWQRTGYEREPRAIVRDYGIRRASRLHVCSGLRRRSPLNFVSRHPRQSWLRDSAAAADLSSIAKTGRQRPL